jgi:hypothetical protein
MTIRSDLPALEPITLIHRRDHVFEGKLSEGGVKIKRARCERPGCGKAHSNLAHHGYAPSMNVGGSGWNPHVFQGAKKNWARVWGGHLQETPLWGWKERFGPFGSVRVEAQVCYPDQGKRDQGNFDYLLHKMFADLLVAEGYLTDDQFYPAEMYVFGGLTAVYTPGEASTIVTVFPAWPSADPLVLPGEQAALL